jgi:Transcriptional Coactivator p15 (PC4)
MSDVLYEKIISQNDDKGSQLRLVINEFKGVQYLHLRKYFLSYEGEWMPTKEGASMPYTISSSYALLDGLLEICSFEEGIDNITEHFEERIQELRHKQNLKLHNEQNSQVS